MLQYKFNDKSYLYKTFAKMLLKNKKLCNFLESYDIILAVPLHRKRFKQRGYNQSQLIAQELAKEYNLHNEGGNEKTKNLKYDNKKVKKLEYDYKKIKSLKYGNKKIKKLENDNKKSKELIYYNDVIFKTKNIKPQSTKNLKDRINDVARNL